MRDKKNKHFTWKKYHRWFGLVLSVFMLVFCVSGIILNHRQLFADCDVSRSFMPPAYHIQNFNNGIIKGSIRIDGHADLASDDSIKTSDDSIQASDDSVLAYGYGGIWLTDSKMKSWKDFNRGLPKNVDGRNIRNMVQTKNGEIWCAAMMDVYRFDGKEWRRFPLPDNHERIADIALTKDSMSLIAMTRSAVYEISGKKMETANNKMDTASDERMATRKIIAQPKGFTPTVTLFKTVWHLHSGAFFGLTGRLVVDAIAIVLIILSITGIILIILPSRIRLQKRLQAKEKMEKMETGKERLAKEKMKKLGKQMVFNAKWHNKLGYATIILTLWISITGMCLRPPLMIPLAMNKTTEKVKDGNVWHDKLRAIRWDAAEGNWLVSTSEGFLRVDEHFMHTPTLLNKEQTPKVSPMGVTVFESDGKGGWLVGSFSGMFRWYPEKNLIVDYFTGKQNIEKSMIPISSHLVSGYSKDFFDGKEVVFDYSKGASFGNAENLRNTENLRNAETKSFPASTPEVLSAIPMSLWNVALELHVGRCYSPFLGPLSNLFVFISGLLITLVLLSGYIILHRRKKKSPKLPQKSL